MPVSLCDLLVTKWIDQLSILSFMGFPHLRSAFQKKFFYPLFLLGHLCLLFGNCYVRCCCITRHSETVAHVPTVSEAGEFRRDTVGASVSVPGSLGLLLGGLTQLGVAAIICKCFTTTSGSWGSSMALYFPEHRPWQSEVPGLPRSHLLGIPGGSYLAQEVTQLHFWGIPPANRTDFICP